MVRNVGNELLQSIITINVRHVYSSPHTRGFWEVCHLGDRSSLSLSLGTGAERSQTCGVPLSKASPSLKVLNSLLLVSSDALTLLAHYDSKIHDSDPQGNGPCTNTYIHTYTQQITKNKQSIRQTVRDSPVDSGVGNTDRRGYPSHHDRYTVVSPAVRVHLAPQNPGLT